MLRQAEDKIGEPEPVVDRCGSELPLGFEEDRLILRLNGPDHERTLYSPTPLNAWDLRVELGTGGARTTQANLADRAIARVGISRKKPKIVTFSQYGIDHVQERINRSMADIAPSDRLSRKLIEFFSESNLSAFHNRIEKNSVYNLFDNKDVMDEGVEKLMLGIADASEVLTIFDEHYEDLLSTEVAKQTVAMRWNQTEEMDLSVRSAAVDNGYACSQADSRYFYMHGLYSTTVKETDEKAGIFVRKQEIASKTVGDGRLVLMQRDSFMIDFNNVGMQTNLSVFNDYIDHGVDNKPDIEIYKSMPHLDLTNKLSDESQDLAVGLVRERSKVKESDDAARRKNGRKKQISGESISEYAKAIGSVVSESFESVMSLAAESGVDYSSEFGVYPANRSYYVYFQDEKLDLL